MSNWYTEVTKEIERSNNRALLLLILQGVRSIGDKKGIYLIKNRKRKGLIWDDDEDDEE